MNPMLSKLNQRSLNGLNPMQVKQAWNNFQALGNPQAAINQAIQNNPMLGALLKNSTPKDAFYALAKQKGVDPNTILNMMK